MREVINKFLLVVDKFVPEVIQDNQDLLIAFVDDLPKTKKKYKNSQKQNIHDIFIKII